MNSLLEHPILAGALKQVTASEWAGSCPWCSGEDRFRVLPAEGPTGRYFCRGCQKQGDGIQFLRDMEGLSYSDACKRLGATPKDRTRQGRRDVRACPVWTPKPSESPDAAWMTAAGRFVDYAVGQMGTNDAGRAYAASRGLTAKTCAALKIGWNPSDLYQDRASWGLPSETNPKTGKPRRVWLPAGLVIPTIREGRVVAAKVRRAAWTPEDSLPKYCAIVGSAQAPMVLAPGQGKPCVVTESELDAFLVAQEARDIVTAIALRTAKAKPDAEAHALLLTAPVILVALDADRAGAEGGPWWKSTYSMAVRWPVPAGKDVGDLAATPGLIRAWILAGLPEPEPKRNVVPDRKPEPSHPAGGPALRRAADLAGGQACPYSPDQLADFALSHPHLRCCPATRPPWNWREASWCSGRCVTPCELQGTN